MIPFSNGIKVVTAVFVTAVTAAFSAACTERQEPQKDIAEISVPKNTVDCSASNQFVRISAGSSWTLALQFDGEEEWASIDVTSGTASGGTVTLSWDENTSREARSLNLVLNSGNASASAVVTQSGKTDTRPTDLKPDTPGKWLELPATDREDLYFFTHEMTVGTYSGRNYSFYLDPDAKIALWVAYPLNKGLIGSGSRTDEWALNPKVPAKYQSVIYKGYRGGYDRGHQLPSADRYAANATTFYGTNITPQRNDLNTGAWVTLETKVRNWCYQFDTLYVVTGADITGSTQYAYDNEGKAITVPTGYFKALLGYKKGGTIGITATTGGYTGIAFYFEHKAYSDAAVMDTQAMTIDALEEKLGYDFFVNLPDRIGQNMSDKVESTKDNWWWKN